MPSINRLSLIRFGGFASFLFLFLFNFAEAQEKKLPTIQLNTESTESREAPAPMPEIPVETGNFNGITPGKTTLKELHAAFGQPANVQKDGMGKGIDVEEFKLEGFKGVAFHIIDQKVYGVVAELQESMDARQLAKDLGMSHIQSVFMTDEKGTIKGEIYPEIGVAFGYDPSKGLGNAADMADGEKKIPMNALQIIFQPVGPDPFLLRAETWVDMDPMRAYADILQALKLDPKNKKALSYRKIIEDAVPELKAGKTGSDAETKETDQKAKRQTEAKENSELENSTEKEGGKQTQSTEKKGKLKSSQKSSRDRKKAETSKKKTSVTELNPPEIDDLTETEDEEGETDADAVEDSEDEEKEFFEEDESRDAEDAEDADAEVPEDAEDAEDAENAEDAEDAESAEDSEEESSEEEEYADTEKEDSVNVQRSRNSHAGTSSIDSLEAQLLEEKNGSAAPSRKKAKQKEEADSFVLPPLPESDVPSLTDPGINSAAEMLNSSDQENHRQENLPQTLSRQESMQAPQSNAEETPNLSELDSEPVSKEPSLQTMDDLPTTLDESNALEKEGTNLLSPDPMDNFATPANEAPALPDSLDAVPNVQEESQTPADPNTAPAADLPSGLGEEFGSGELPPSLEIPGEIPEERPAGSPAEEPGQNSIGIPAFPEESDLPPSLDDSSPLNQDSIQLPLDDGGLSVDAQDAPSTQNAQDSQIPDSISIDSEEKQPQEENPSEEETPAAEEAPIPDTISLDTPQTQEESQINAEIPELPFKDEVFEKVENLTRNQHFTEALRLLNDIRKEFQDNPFISFRANLIEGDILMVLPEPNAEQAYLCHRRAANQGEKLLSSGKIIRGVKHPLTEEEREKVQLFLLDTWLGIASDLRDGPWEEKSEHCTKWLQKANQLLDEIAVERESSTPEKMVQLRYQVTHRSLTIAVSLGKEVEIFPYANRFCDASLEMLKNAGAAQEYYEICTKTSQLLDNTSTICVLRGEEALAQRYLNRAISMMELVRSKQKIAGGKTDFLLAKLYYHQGRNFALRAKELEKSSKLSASEKKVSKITLHSEAVKWYKKSIPCTLAVVQKRQIENLYEIGCMTNGMSVSYSEIGDIKRAIVLLKTGIFCLEQHVAANPEVKSQLRIPYQNMIQLLEYQGMEKEKAEYLQKFNALF